MVATQSEINLILVMLTTAVGCIALLIFIVLILRNRVCVSKSQFYPINNDVMVAENDPMATSPSPTEFVRGVWFSSTRYPEATPRPIEENTLHLDISHMRSVYKPETQDDTQNIRAPISPISKDIAIAQIV